MAPTGWIDRGQRFRNAGASAQYVEMRGVSEVDPSLFQIITNWNGGVDEVTITPTWAGEISSVKEIAQGWQGRIANNNIVQLLDLQGTKFGAHLGEFAGNGPKILQWMPTSQIVDRDDGWWVAEEFILGGAWNNFDWLVQSDDVLVPCSTYGPHVPHSIAPYHKTKSNDQVGGDYCKAGKREQLLAPLAMFWGGFKTDLKGYVVGRLEIEGDRIRKLYPLAVMAPYIAASNFVSVDATLGNTIEGSSNISSGNAYWTNDSYTAPVTDTFSSITTINVTDLTLAALSRNCIYTGNPATTTNPLLANSDTGNVVASSSIVTGGARFQNTWNYGTPPTMTSGVDHHLTCHRNGRFAYDAGGSGRQYSSTVATAPRNPIGSAGAHSLRISLWATYGAAPPTGIIPQIMHHRRMMRH